MWQEDRPLRQVLYFSFGGAMMVCKLLMLAELQVTRHGQEWSEQAVGGFDGTYKVVMFTYHFLPRPLTYTRRALWVACAMTILEKLSSIETGRSASRNGAKNGQLSREYNVDIGTSHVPRMRGNIGPLQDKDLYGSGQQSSTGVNYFTGTMDGIADQRNEIDAA